MLPFLFILIAFTVVFAIVTISLSIMMIFLYWKLEVYKANHDAAKKGSDIFTKLKVYFLSLLKIYHPNDIALEECNDIEKSAKTIRKYFLFSFSALIFLIITTTVYGFFISVVLE